MNILVKRVIRQGGVIPERFYGPARQRLARSTRSSGSGGESEQPLPTGASRRDIFSFRIVSCIVISLIISQPLFSQSERSLIREGNRSYGAQHFGDAEASYRKALEVEKDFQAGIFNLGDALYKQERFNEAAEQYRIAATAAPDALTKAQALHNLGNAHLKAQKLEESIAAYKEALKHNPGDFDTKYNLEYAKQLLERQQQQREQDQEEREKEEKEKKEENKPQDEQQQDQRQKEEGSQEQKQQREQRQQELQKQEISKEDAERILEALKNEEQKVQKKLHKKVPARVQVEKDW